MDVERKRNEPRVRDILYWVYFFPFISRNQKRKKYGRENKIGYGIYARARIWKIVEINGGERPKLLYHTSVPNIF